MTLTLPVTVHCDGQSCGANARVTAGIHVGLFGETTTIITALPPGWSRFASRVGCPDHPADVLFATSPQKEGQR